MTRIVVPPGDVVEKRTATPVRSCGILSFGLMSRSYVWTPSDTSQTFGPESVTSISPIGVAPFRETANKTPLDSRSAHDLIAPGVTHCHPDVVGSDHNHFPSVDVS